MRASHTVVIYRLPPLELDREGRPLGKHRYVTSADQLETELLTHVLHTDVAGMVSAAALIHWKAAVNEAGGWQAQHSAHSSCLVWWCCDSGTN